MYTGYGAPPEHRIRCFIILLKPAAMAAGDGSSGEAPIDRSGPFITTPAGRSLRIQRRQAHDPSSAPAPSTPQATTGSHASTHRQHDPELTGDSLLSPTTRTIRPFQTPDPTPPQAAHAQQLAFDPDDPFHPARTSVQQPDRADAPIAPAGDLLISVILL
ncbi:hypothetical protein ACLOJK_039135 [Asimina triloba]